MPAACWHWALRFPSLKEKWYAIWQACQISHHQPKVHRKARPKWTSLIIFTAAGCRTWIRTKIDASKGRCPTIRRSGNFTKRVYYSAKTIKINKPTTKNQEFSFRTLIINLIGVLPDSGHSNILENVGMFINGEMLFGVQTKNQGLNP